ncbi:MAG TPA: hypothetical protein VNX46_03740 [Candidatus Acidoferrum sp.]|jgi:hypothetical protein|nr:hypothetical protein [Candidatus Acidoferrum sp.]
MKIILNLFRCTFILNVIAFVLAIIFVVVTYRDQPPEYLARLCGAVWLAPCVLSFTVSFILVFGNWRAALSGLLVIFAGFFIAALFPEL